MHRYIVLRGVERFTRRALEDLSDLYFNFRNKKTKKLIGAMQIGIREVRTFEIIYPATEKEGIKKLIKDIVLKHKHVAIHFLPFTKKDKYVNGVEFL